ncbi:MAG TPA: magnesium transporter CorA family protein [Steroidobacteraceae bacterium]|nr:magnesium transporter CorA family protein [Steroidobacteraceae bacterium]
MLRVFVPGPSGLVSTEWPAGAPPPENALWLDLCEPTPAEEQQVEQGLGIDVPSREEMREIESSNRLYEENGALHMTATLATKLDSDQGQSTQVTFILAGKRLITNRYADPLSFRRFIAFAQTHPAACASPSLLLAGLLEAIVNRIADVLEQIGSDIEAISARVFTQRHRRPHDFRPELGQIGQGGELVSKTRESLVSLSRLLSFLQQSNSERITADARASLRTVSGDVVALSDHASFLGDKVQFLLDATLGMVTIDQNNILKIFSVVAVLLLPPSVIGAFYGMNFSNIPWLHEPWGVWAALAMMVVSAVAPYAYFRRKGWL